jgi:hypothetical protein
VLGVVQVNSTFAGTQFKIEVWGYYSAVSSPVGAYLGFSYKDNNGAAGDGTFIGVASVTPVLNTLVWKAELVVAVRGNGTAVMYGTVKDGTTERFINVLGSTTFTWTLATLQKEFRLRAQVNTSGSFTATVTHVNVVAM